MLGEVIGSHFDNCFSLVLSLLPVGVVQDGIRVKHDRVFVVVYV